MTKNEKLMWAVLSKDWDYLANTLHPYAVARVVGAECQTLTSTEANDLCVRVFSILEKRRTTVSSRLIALKIVVLDYDVTLKFGVDPFWVTMAERYRKWVNSRTEKLDQLWKERHIG